MKNKSWFAFKLNPNNNIVRDYKSRTTGYNNNKSTENKIRKEQGLNERGAYYEWKLYIVLSCAVPV